MHLMDPLTAEEVALTAEEVGLRILLGHKVLAVFSVVSCRLRSALDRPSFGECCHLDFELVFILEQVQGL